MTGSTTIAQPAKLILERRVRPGSEQIFEAWIRELMEATTRSHALEGSSVLTTQTGEYVILLRFTSPEELERWQRSPEMLALLARGDRHATAGDRIVRTGFETWFTLPGLPAPAAAPPPWKMALVTWLALVPQVIVLAKLVPPSVPFLANVAITTAIPVAVLTWVVMPRLTALLYGWLYAPRPG